MRKIINFVFVLLFLFVLCGCKKDDTTTINEEKEDEPYYTPLKIVAEHSTSTIDDEVNPYIVLRSKPEGEFINYQVIVFLNFPMNYKGSVLTKRYYNYLQCDYGTKEENTTYYHNFDHSDDDGAHLSNAIKLASRYLTKLIISDVAFDLKYEYELDNIKQEKELKFLESMLEYEEENFNTESTSFDVVVAKNEEEDYNRYKLIISLDESVNVGHYDIQTWVKCDSGIIPFVGYYHYNAINGSISTVSDEKIEKSEHVSEIYCMVRYYDNLGHSTDTYYKKKVD